MNEHEKINHLEFPAKDIEATVIPGWPAVSF